MNKYSLSSRFAYRAKNFLDKANNNWQDYIGYKLSRDHAKRFRKKVILENGRKIVDRKLLKTIKEYCLAKFNDKSYWPWLALYTELKGEFKEGWIPEDYYRFKLLPRMNPQKYMKFSEAKTFDYKIFGEAIIEPIILRLNGRFFGKDGNVITKSEMKSLLNEINEEIIIKPDDGLGGKGIIFIHPQELCFEDLPSGTNLIFQKVVRQHPELKKLHPYSINTFRVLTYLNKDGDIKIKFAILRFGKGRSRVDNASGGGGWVYIQHNSKPSPNAFDLEGSYYGEKHPDTGFEFSKLNLPFFEDVLKFCKKNHRKFPYTRIIGWDVFVDQEGSPKLIEWNANNPFFGSIEAHFGPFFAEVIE